MDDVTVLSRCISRDKLEVDQPSVMRRAVLEVICDKIPKLKTRIQAASSQPAQTQQQTSSKSKKGRKGK
uniref:Uncharacterized protein n=1 Tax=Magallana gigas TaxID=29159 RepID=K1PKT3_MAGGI